MLIKHMGIIVGNIEENINLYLKMGYIMRHSIVCDKIQHNRIAILESGSSPDIELIEPIDENSTVYNFKVGYHHICYETEPGEDIISHFKNMKVGKIFTKPIVAPALDNREVVFACLRNGTFVEFIL